MFSCGAATSLYISAAADFNHKEILQFQNYDLIKLSKVYCLFDDNSKYLLKTAKTFIDCKFAKQKLSLVYSINLFVYQPSLNSFEEGKSKVVCL